MGRNLKKKKKKTVYHKTRTNQVKNSQQKDFFIQCKTLNFSGLNKVKNIRFCFK